MPNAINIQIGRNIREERLAQGVLQQDLAARIGVVPQQLVKYETGLSKIGSGRLWQISQVLDCPVSRFFEGLAGPRPKSAFAPCGRVSPESVELARFLEAIKDDAVIDSFKHLARLYPQ